MRPETREWVEIAEGDFQTATREAAVADSPNFHAVCFHCQQSAEKYLKAFLTEHSIYFPKTHDLEILLASVGSVAPEAMSLSQATKGLTGYGIDVRYPGGRPGANEAEQALSDCTTVRSLLRGLLGLPV
jgi:HEPN domain-containing protein